ncbi:hypothetical protein [uncultured Sphingomonas sp.]|uniref:hypothetical protein n=1 Tax=uncultured Sphingomonas sp. TaxID=158754 RepID=UPI0035CBC65C
MIAMLVLAAIATVTVRQDGPALTPDEARAMAPSTLADQLLAAGHPLIVEDAVAPFGMEAPQPPWLTRINLISDAVQDFRKGFCVKHRYRVTFPDLGRWDPEDRKQQPNRPDHVIDEIAYRLLTKQGCAGSIGSSYFTPRGSETDGALKVVALIGKAVRLAKSHPPHFPLAVDDQLDREMQIYMRTQTGKRSADAPKYDVITDPRKALATLAIGATVYVGHQLSGGELLDPSLLREPDGHLRERWSLLVGGTVTVDVVLDGGRIAALKIRYAIPAPF